MNNIEEFALYLGEKKKKQKYIDERVGFISSFYDELDGKSPTAKSIDTFIRNRWSGYVSRDKNRFALLNEYADACEQFDPEFANAFHKYIHETFEGETRKAMREYKNDMVFIPNDTVINRTYLDGLSNAEFVVAFKDLQSFLCDIYDAIEHDSPFDWGFPSWNGLTWYGLVQNRVVMLLNALVQCGKFENSTLIVDKYCFDEHSKKKADEQIICKPPEKTRLLLEGLIKMGLHIEGLDDMNLPFFCVSFPDNPNVINVIYSYFKEKNTDITNHIRYFSYRFIQDPATQSHETFFLAKTDGEPEHLREIYYWLYDEAVKYGFNPTGEEKMYCYLYKKGTKEWLLVGKGSSYHEEEFLHSVNYSLSVKFTFSKIYHTQPDKIEWLKNRFPSSFATRWGGCYKCKEKKGTMESCKNRVITNPDMRMGCVKGYFYFHDPTFDDIKEILEMYKLENNIKSL